MSAPIRIGLPVLVALASFTVSCASLVPGDPRGVSPGMDQVRLERLFEQQVEKVAGGVGYVRSRAEGMEILLVSDPTTDRMQLIVQVPFDETVGVQHLVGMLQANLHPGLDARYAVSEGGFFAVFAHRLSTLTDDDFVAGYRQSLALAREFEDVVSGAASLEEAPVEPRSP